MQQGSVKTILKLCRNIFKILFIQLRYLHAHVQFVGNKLICMFQLHGGIKDVKGKVLHLCSTYSFGFTVALTEWVTH
jgi:hypothetical protein